MLSACFCSQMGRMARSKARALMVVRPATISAIMASRVMPDLRSSLLALAMTEPERQATIIKIGRITIRIGKIGVAIT